MKKISIIRALALCLLIAQLVCLISCNKTDTPDVDTPSDSTSGDTTAADTTTAESVTGISLVDSTGKAIYSITRADSASKTLISDVVDFRGRLVAAGIDAALKNDWVKNPEDIDNESYEILIGQTNRDATSGLSLALKDYFIDIIGNKIVICGGSDDATCDALAYFIANCLDLENKTVNIPQRIEHLTVYPGADFSIAGVPIKDYTIVYSNVGESEIGIDVANALQKMIEQTSGITLPTKLDTKAESEYEIVIGNAKRDHSAKLNETAMGDFDYKLEVSGKKMYFAAGGCFGLQYCIKYLKDNYLSKSASIEEGFTTSGSMYGKQVFDLEEGAELRIMSNNVWNCDTNKDAWKAIGEDCSAEVRSIGLAATYMAYYPDVICFQEMSTKMLSLIRIELKKYGYEYSMVCYTKGTLDDNTCLLYRSDRLTLLNKGFHRYAYGSNGGSKSYTWGQFEITGTGKKFIALSTHLWWMSESAQAGSDKWRADQAAEIVTRADLFDQQYNCPVFAMGDFNTRTNSDAFKVFTDGGFEDTFDLATVYADDNRGYHSCGNDGYARETVANPYKGYAIDHIMLRNGGDTKVLTFNHARPYFYIKLSDHYPVFVDVVIGG